MAGQQKSGGIYWQLEYISRHLEIHWKYQVFPRPFLFTKRNPVSMQKSILTSWKQITGNGNRQRLKFMVMMQSMKMTEITL